MCIIHCKWSSLWRRLGERKGWPGDRINWICIKTDIPAAWINCHNGVRNHFLCSFHNFTWFAISFYVTMDFLWKSLCSDWLLQINDLSDWNIGLFCLFVFFLHLELTSSKIYINSIEHKINQRENCIKISFQSMIYRLCIVDVAHLLK